MKRYLLFDADGTLYDFGASELIALDQLFRIYGIPYSEENINAYHQANDYCWDQFERGLMDQNTLKSYRFRIFFDRIGKDKDAVEAGNLFIDFLSEHGIMLPGAVEFLESVKDRKKALITNGIAKVQHGRIDRSGTGRFFDRIFISEEIGSNKPDPEFFRFVLNELGLTPDMCLVIGDGENSDILGARNAGIDSVYISFRGRVSSNATYSVSSFEELKALIDAL